MFYTLRWQYRPIVSLFVGRNACLFRAFRGGNMVFLLTLWENTPQPLLWLHLGNRRRELGRAYRTPR